MALIRLDHTPETIKVNTPLNIILPDPGSARQLPIRKRKVLYLLHGLSDDASAWQRYSTIETLASHYGLVVVMPSVGRSFYADLPNGQKYFTYLIEELPQYLKDVFNLDPKREDTLIAGLSMGGYGVLKAALNFPERFFAAASFSGVVSMEILRVLKDDARKQEFEYIFGDLNQIFGSEHDPMVWLQRAAQNIPALPHLYLACGRQDDLYPVNMLADRVLTQMGIPHVFVEEDGMHNWDFWDKQIKQFIHSVLGEP